MRWESPSQEPVVGRTSQPPPTYKDEEPPRKVTRISHLS